MLAHRLTLLTALAVAAAGPALADTRLSLAETGTVQVAPDDLRAVLRAEAEAPTRQAAQAEVNRATEAALVAIRAASGIAASTTGYGVWQETRPDKSPGPAQWHAQQSLVLHGGDGDAVLALVGHLQAQGLATEALGWGMSPEREKAAHDDALRQAILALRARAEMAASLLGLHVGSFATVSLDPRADAPVPLMARAAAMGAPAPQAVREDISVSVTVTAEALLTP